MAKKKDFVVEQEQDSEEEYYLADDVEETQVSEEPEKKPATSDKKLELAILKEQNKAKQLENDAKKLEAEKVEAEWKHEFEKKKLDTETKLEERKIAVSEKANDIAEKQVTADQKKSKRERILGYVKAGVGIAGVIASTVFAYKRMELGAKFEETDSWTTATGKDAYADGRDAAKDLKNLDKKF